MTSSKLLVRIAAGALLALALNGSQAVAQNFPTRPITLIVPFPAGGPSDTLARSVAQAMSAPLGQSVVVENVSGASGAIGLVRMAKSAPDGYTIGFGTIGTHVANVALFSKLPYDPVADFAPIGVAGSAPTMLLVKTGLPVTDLKSFVDYVKANGATMSYGSAGVGSISHLACVILLSELKLTVTHVPYRGVAPAINDLMGGHIDFMCDQSTTALPLVAGGKAKAVAVLTKSRLPQAAEIPTAAEAGYRDVDIRAWNALFAPKDTPAPVLARLNEALRQAVSDPALMKQMGAVGVDLPTGSGVAPAAVTQLIASGLQRDVPALRARGERLD
jgi:tripartite-type tricarboxylate transporter receptor subunit TctC